MQTLAFLLLAACSAGAYVPKTVLGISGSKFTINGKETFLLGCSYYGALTAKDQWIREDLRQLRRWGFNWIRVWATWAVYDFDVSVVNEQGELRPGLMRRLVGLVRLADQLGMVVDITFSRGRPLRDHQAHMRAVRNVAAALKPYRNVYFDLGNERNVRDARYVSMADLAQLVATVKEVDPQRLVTGSHAGDIPEGELRGYLLQAKVDFIAPHRPRVPGSPAQTEARTRQYLAAMARIGRVVPVHYQEPFRRNFNPRTFQPRVDDFITDALGALRGGAAGWCLHIGANRAAPDRQPRKDFDMRKARLWVQMDKVELEVAHKLAKTLGLPCPALGSGR